MYLKEKHNKLFLCNSFEFLFYNYLFFLDECDTKNYFYLNCMYDVYIH